MNRIADLAPAPAAHLRRVSDAMNDLADPEGVDEVFDSAAAAVGLALDTDPDGAAKVFTRHAQEAPMVGAIVAETGVLAAVAGGDTVHYADAALRGSHAALAALAGSLRRGGKTFADIELHGGGRALAVAAAARDAANWPLSAGAVQAAQSGVGRVAILVFAPALSPGFTAVLQRVFALTPGEARLAVTLFECGTLADAARLLGAAPATLRERMRGLLRKTGSPRRAALMARITELAAGDYPRADDRAAVIRASLGLTAAEARVADALTQGCSVPQIAAQNRVSAHTVRAQADAAFAKTSQTSAAGLARLVSELLVLSAWTAASEIRRHDQHRLLAVTRIVLAPGGRRIAAADYGPRDGAPVLCFHPGLAHRGLRTAFREALAARGLRAVSFDLPDCGLTDAAPGRPFFAASADDAERVADALRLGPVRVFAPFGGAAPALEFAARRPEAIVQGLLLMPRPPGDAISFTGPLQRIFKATMSRPLVSRAFFEALRRSSSGRLVRWMHMHSSVQTDSDRAATANAAYLEERVSEVMAALSRGAGGNLELDRAYRSWTIPDRIGGRWLVVETGAKVYPVAQSAAQIWGALPDLRLVRLDDAGRSAMFTHPAALAALFD